MKKIVGLALLLVSPFAFAIDVGSDVTVATLANAFIKSLEYIPSIFSALSYVAGVILGFKGVLKLKEHNESKGQVKLVTPIMLLIASALFLGLPVVLDIGITTVGYQKTAQKEWNF
jgi:hypothetical protein